MKKIIIGMVSVLIILAIGIALINNFIAKSNSANGIADEKSVNKISNLVNEIVNSNNIEKQKNEQNDGYEIIVSKKEITIEKGKETSFDITFTNPDVSSIREYIHCEDQNDIILVKYSDLENKKITVYVEALKVGTTEILVCDYEYPDMREIVKVNVLETNDSESRITKEMAYDGVKKYCQVTYNLSMEEDSANTYLTMGDETEKEYKVTYRSYTGAMTYFYVDKLSGTTRIVEYVPTLDIESEAGTIDLNEYLNKNN